MESVPSNFRVASIPDRRTLRSAGLYRRVACGFAVTTRDANNPCVRVLLKVITT